MSESMKLKKVPKYWHRVTFPGDAYRKSAANRMKAFQPVRSCPEETIMGTPDYNIRPQVLQFVYDLKMHG